MSMIERSIDGMAFLSGQLGAAFKRRLREASGVALLSLAMIALLALLTWSVQDPSLSHATDRPVHNLLGRPGAIAADLMMQLLGLGALALILPILVWGYRLLGHRPLNRERLRVTLWLASAVLSAAFASCLPRTAHWPLPTGLGGVIGDAVLRLPAPLLGASLQTSHRLVAAIVFGVAMLLGFAAAIGLVWNDAGSDDDGGDAPEPDADEGAWISLGFIAHHLLSLRARVSLMFRRAPPLAPAGDDSPVPHRAHRTASRRRCRGADRAAGRTRRHRNRRRRRHRAGATREALAARAGQAGQAFGRRLRLAVAQSSVGTARQ